MIDSDSETDFDIYSARYITQTILEDDVKIYRKFLPEIQNLDTQSFKNMFNGNKNYCYNVHNRLQFNLLLDKFDNFRTLLEEWYEDPSTYAYFKELWINYISLESLRDKSEYEIQNFLLSKNVKYMSWPQRIKNRFIQICKNTTNTIISKFRKVFEKLPQIVKKILGMFCSASEFYKEKGEKILSNFMKQYALSIVGGFINLGVNCFPIIKEVIFDLSSKFKLSDFSFKNCINFMKNYASDFKELAKIGLPIIEKLSYGFACGYKLYTSIKSIVEINNTMKKIKGFETLINEIEKNFRINKESIENRLNSNESRDIQSLNNTIESCIISINEDKKSITKVINDINTCLEESKNAKKKEIFNLIDSVVQTGVAITGAILTGGLTCAFYIGGTILNGSSIVLNGISINNLKKNIKELKRILQKAQNLEKEIDDEINKIKLILNENKEAAPTFF